MSVARLLGSRLLSELHNCAIGPLSVRIWISLRGRSLIHLASLAELIRREAAEGRRGIALLRLLGLARSLLYLLVQLHSKVAMVLALAGCV